jgi:uncharacterized membrane protein YGL010W
MRRRRDGSKKEEGTSMASNFLEKYRRDHTHPMNKATHALGIPMIVASLPIVFFNWQIAAAMFVVGWILQFIGHAFEGNKPSFFSSPMFLLIGPLWTIRRALGLEPKPPAADRQV